MRQKMYQADVTARVGKLPMAACALLSMGATTAFAGNGLNLIGYGTESVAMGGADVALAGDTSSLNSNPAGLARIRGKALDVYGAIAYGMDVGHADSFGNDRNVDHRWIYLTGGGYARAVGDACTVGIGVFGQGGAGVVYDELITAFGTRDELSSSFRIAKFAPGGACRLNDKLAIGGSVGITYADIRQKVFFKTSVLNPLTPSSAFFGYEITDASSLEAGVRVGVQYDIAPGTTLGATFSPQLDLPLTDGELVSNQNAIGLGRVTYEDLRLDGLALPREVGLGVAFHPVKPVLVSIKLAWLDWSSALNTSTLTATRPDNPAASSEIRATSTLGWDDQWVIAIGGAYELDARTILRAGYNYGRDPIPAANTSPLLSAIGEHHVTLGFVHARGANSEISAAFEYQFAADVTYTNPTLPFGPNARERANFPALHVQWSKRW